MTETSENRSAELPGSALRLDGVLERYRFHPGLIAALALPTGLFAYMIVGNATTVLWLMAGGASPDGVLRDIATLMETEVVAFLGGNAVGLIVGLGLLSVVLVRLQTTSVGAFLRFRKPDPKVVALSVAGLLVLMPVVQWAGHLNARMPLPDVLRAIEEMQMELLEQVFLGDVSLVLAIVLVAVAPALGEEIFFRGYVQRNLERAAGAVMGIVVTGLLFGLFHLRLTQLLPLALLGVYLAWLTWRTGSLWVPIVVHFVNNAVALAAAEMLAGREGFDLAALEAVEVPTYLAAICLVLFGAVTYVLHGVAARNDNH